MQEDAEMREKCPKCGNLIKIGDGRNQCSQWRGESEPEPSRKDTGQNFGQHLKRCSGRVQCPGCKRFFQKRSMPNHLKVCCSLNGKGLRKKRRAYQHFFFKPKTWGKHSFETKLRPDIAGKIYFGTGRSGIARKNRNVSYRGGS